MMFALKQLCQIAIILLGSLLMMGNTHASLSLDAKGTGPSLPQSDVGRAGMIAEIVDDGGHRVLRALGGANFPDGLPWEGGKKVFHADGYSLDVELLHKDTSPSGSSVAWEKLPWSLPAPVAYAAYGSSSKGLVIAGGCGENGHLKDVYLLRPDGTIRPLPPLPKSLSYASFIVRNNRLYVFGGQETPESTEASPSAYYFDLSLLGDILEKNQNAQEQERLKLENATQEGKSTKVEKSLEWVPLPDMPGGGRMLATAGTSGGIIYLCGGVSLSPDKNGKPRRTYLKDVVAFDTTANQYLPADAVADMPIPLAASPSPAFAREGKVLLLGGDDGSHYGKDPTTHPGQSKGILSYDTLNKQWTREGEWTIGLATAPLVVDGDMLYTVSGEIKPGIRTPELVVARSSYLLDLHAVDYAVFALIVLVVVLLWIQIARRGIRNVAIWADPSSRPGFYAWVVVALLWVVAMLNYFDRQLLTTIREPVIRDIPQTEMQFGLLTGVFLMIYAVLSPVGGFLADKFSRRVVILVSLVVWSAVTWVTGHVHDYTTLFIARALMGVSEACYIPAALALITDYHRGRTRSLATGLHMSGVYAGMALAGLGGGMAEMIGWRLTFGVFGLIGVGYALVLVLFLRDPKTRDARETTEGLVDKGDGEKLLENGEISVDAVQKPTLVTESAEGDRPGLKYVLGNILNNKCIWMLMVVVACGGAANWFLLAWFPTLLQEKFNLSLGVAGTNATLWSTIAKYVAVLAGAVIADQWSLRNARGRSLLPGIVFCAAAPLIALSPFIPSDWTIAFGLLLVFVASQGLAQGTMDATLMPIMRSHIDGRFAATGYGFLNLVSAGFGAFTVIYGGKLKDMGIALGTTLAYTGGLLLIAGILLLLLPKPKPKSADQV